MDRVCCRYGIVKGVADEALGFLWPSLFLLLCKHYEHCSALRITPLQVHLVRRKLIHDLVLQGQWQIDISKGQQQGVSRSWLQLCICMSQLELLVMMLVI